jgi:hypothetical protein
VPVQTPPWQVVLTVQGLPSSQVVLLGLFVTVQPLPSQTEVAWHRLGEQL